MTEHRLILLRIIEKIFKQLCCFIVVHRVRRDFSYNDFSLKNILFFLFILKTVVQCFYCKHFFLFSFSSNALLLAHGMVERYYTIG